MSSIKALEECIDKSNQVKRESEERSLYQKAYLRCMNSFKKDAVEEIRQSLFEKVQKLPL